MIIPSILTKSQKDLNQKLSLVKNHFPRIQLDIADNHFVKNSSFQFPFKLPKNFHYEAHLMIKNPDPWIKKHGKKVQTIIPHLETVTPQTLNLIKKIKKTPALALKPETPVKKLIPYLKQIKQVTLLCVHPGFYGSKFLPSVLKKIPQVKKLNPKLKIELDGGIFPKNYSKAKKTSAPYFIVGGYLFKNKNPQQALKKLKHWNSTTQ